MGAQLAALPDGRVHFNHGPIDIIAQMDGPQSDSRERAILLAWSRFQTILEELCSELPLLRSPDRARWASLEGSIAKRMVLAVSQFDSFITPMAAVAGAVADELRELVCREERLRRVVMNNGGDTSLYLASGEECRFALVSDYENCQIGGTLRITASDGIQGVATSGWRGRSHSLGIADAVTVAAVDCATADAAATLIANAIDLPGHPGVHRTSASRLSPDSDLGNLLVTTHVDPLTGAEAATALSRGWSLASKLASRGVIESASMFLCGKSLVAEHGGQDPPALPRTQRNTSS